MDKSNFKINSRKESIYGIIALALILVAIILFSIGIYILAFETAIDSKLIGGLEFTSIMMTVSAFVLSIIGEIQKECYHKSSHVALVLASVLSVIHIIVIVRSF